MKRESALSLDVRFETMQAAFKKLPPKRRTEILDAAASVFAERGYHQASTPDICARAGVSNGALYKYFRNKEAIYVSVMNHGIDLMIHDLFRKCTERSGSFFEVLEALFVGLGRFTKRRRPYVEMWVDLASCSMNRFAGEIAAKVESEGRSLFRRLIEEARARGELDPSIDAELVTYALDCQMTLFTYWLVSEYHRKRFSAFFRHGPGSLSQEKKIALVIESARLLIGREARSV